MRASLIESGDYGEADLLLRVSRNISSLRTVWGIIELASMNNCLWKYTRTPGVYM